MYVNPRESAPWLVQMPSTVQDLAKVWQGECFQRYLAEGHWKEKNFRATWRRLVALGLEAARGRIRILDFGCGPGLFLRLASEEGAEAYGVEPDTPSALYGTQILGQSIFNGFLKDAGFSDGYFDAVVSFQVFEHLPDPTAELHEIRRVLRRDGLLALDVPNVDNLVCRVLRGRHRHFATPQHLWFYTPAAMRKLLERAGFEVLAVDFPTRYLSLEHVCRHHIAMYNPRISELLVRFLSRLGLLKVTVAINLRDVMCVYARKGVD
jgi:SAM-dependent methyltransferase